MLILQSAGNELFWCCWPADFTYFCSAIIPAASYMLRAPCITLYAANACCCLSSVGQAIVCSSLACDLQEMAHDVASSMLDAFKAEPCHDSGKLVKVLQVCSKHLSPELVQSAKMAMPEETFVAAFEACQRYSQVVAAHLEEEWTRLPLSGVPRS
jgi:hypothetical protein